jgi:hypothetical protein
VKRRNLFAGYIVETPMLIPRLFAVFLPRLGIDTKFVVGDKAEDFAKAIDEKTKAIYIERYALFRYWLFTLVCSSLWWTKTNGTGWTKFCERNLNYSPVQGFIIVFQHFNWGHPMLIEDSIGNPKYNIPDFEAIAKVAHEHGVPVIVSSAESVLLQG